MLAGLASLLCFSSPAAAAPFPEKTDEAVQDEANHLKKEDIKKLEESLAAYPDKYKVVVVEGTTPEAASPDEYAQKLYDNYNLSDNTMMIVLDANTDQLGVYPGPNLIDKGMEMELLHEKISTFYLSWSNQKEYAKGIEQFVTEVNNEIKSPTTSTATPAAGTAATTAAEEPISQENTIWTYIPWWMYLVVLGLTVLTVYLAYLFMRRRNLLKEIDDVEYWKEELVEKIQTLEVEKSLRRTTGLTEERLTELANRKENLLKMQIPDVEMIILEADDACDRFRFQLALGLINEGREMLSAMEVEVNELKNDASKVVKTKTENKVVLPEIGKLYEHVERKLSEVRLEYGLAFHEMKTNMDKIDNLRIQVKSDLASGDNLKAYETTMQAHQMLKQMAEGLEQVPHYVDMVRKEMTNDFRQLEQDISVALGDGYDLSQTYLETSLLQAKQLLQAAVSALEEGNLTLLETHAKAFEMNVDSIYKSMEDSVLSKQQVAATATAVAVGAENPTAEEKIGTESDAPQEGQDAQAITGLDDSDVVDGQAFNQGDTVESHNVDSAVGENDEAKSVDSAAAFTSATAGTGFGQAAETVIYSTSFTSVSKEENTEETAGWGNQSYSGGFSEDERSTLLTRDDDAWDSADDYEEEERRASRSGEETDAEAYRYEYETDNEGAFTQGGYESVYTTTHTDANAYQTDEEALAGAPVEGEIIEEANVLVIETEDDALDEMERISNALMRIRQQIKRSYLPGVPSELRSRFEEVVQMLAQVKNALEQYQYSLDEVAHLLTETNEILLETDQLAEKTIVTCQAAEGAIQYTNRYRRQNRQVNDLLTKAETAFRQLHFAEALDLAEQARLIIEGQQEDEGMGSWLLRRKKKGGS